MFVGVDHDRRTAWLRNDDRHNLIFEASFGDRSHGPLVAEQRKPILLLARDAKTFGYVLRGLAHTERWIALCQFWIGEPPAERRVVQLDFPAWKCRLRLGHHERRPGHRLYTAGNEHIPFPHFDRLGGRRDGLHARSTQAVHGLSGDGDRQSRQQQRHPRDVAVILACLVAGAEDDVLDLVGIDPGAADEFLDHVGRQIIGPHVPQDAVVAAHRRANGVDDYGIAELRGHGRITDPILDPGYWILDLENYIYFILSHTRLCRRTASYDFICHPRSRIRDPGSLVPFEVCLP